MPPRRRRQKSAASADDNDDDDGGGGGEERRVAYRYRYRSRRRGIMSRVRDLADNKIVGYFALLFKSDLLWAIVGGYLAFQMVGLKELALAVMGNIPMVGPLVVQFTRYITGILGTVGARGVAWRQGKKDPFVADLCRPVLDLARKESDGFGTICNMEVVKFAETAVEKADYFASKGNVFGLLVILARAVREYRREETKKDRSSNEGVLSQFQSIIDGTTRRMDVMMGTASGNVDSDFATGIKKGMTWAGGLPKWLDWITPAYLYTIVRRMRSKPHNPIIDPSIKGRMVG